MVVGYVVLSIPVALLSIILSPFGWLGALLAAPFITSGVMLFGAVAFCFVDDVRTVERTRQVRKESA